MSRTTAREAAGHLGDLAVAFLDVSPLLAVAYAMTAWHFARLAVEEAA